MIQFVHSDKSSKEPSCLVRKETHSCIQWPTIDLGGTAGLRGHTVEEKLVAMVTTT
jgi:hypothetical protein